MTINANDYGFSPENSGRENSDILNNLLKNNNDIEVTAPGEYKVCGAIIMGSNQSLTFSEGVFLKRESSPNVSYVIINKGAYTREYDENITITGLNIICNEVQSAQPTPENKSIIPGLRGHLSFFYVKNLVIRNFTALDLPPKDFGIHVCSFENILIENVKIEGEKDAVHLGRGKDFIIRNGHFKTFDDPIALNAHDYASSNPQLGWIENGLIENCHDYNDNDTTGYFCRILAGSWCDWYKGMKIQNSDTVIHNNRMYRALMKPNGEIFTSVTPPTHTEGYKTEDGINWVFVQNEIYYNCGCKNIKFKDIYIEKDRPVAFSIHFDNDNWSRSVYPGSSAPIQENITFENINISADVPVFLYSVSPLKNFIVSNSALCGAKIELTELEQVPEYNLADFEFINTSLPEVSATPKRKYTFKNTAR